MCITAQIVHSWENLMRNVCVHMDLGNLRHLSRSVLKLGSDFVSLQSRRNSRDTFHLWFFFLSQYAVMSLSVYLFQCFDIWLRHQGPLAPCQHFSLSACLWVWNGDIVWTHILEEKQPTHCTVCLKKLFSKHWRTILHCSSSSIKLNQFMRTSNRETVSYFYWFWMSILFNLSGPVVSIEHSHL